MLLVFFIRDFLVAPLKNLCALGVNRCELHGTDGDIQVTAFPNNSRNKFVILCYPSQLYLIQILFYGKLYCTQIRQLKLTLLQVMCVLQKKSSRVCTADNLVGTMESFITQSLSKFFSEGSQTTYNTFSSYGTEQTHQKLFNHLKTKL